MSKRQRQPPDKQSQRGQPFITILGVAILFAFFGLVGNALPARTPISEASSLTDQSVTVLTKALNVRTGPGTGYGIIHLLNKDEQVWVLGVNKDRTWYRISYGAGEGWVIADGKLILFEGNASRLAIIPNPTYTGLSLGIVKTAHKGSI